MKKNIIIILFVSIFANFAISYFGRGSFMYVIVIPISIIWVAAPILTISLILLIIGRKLQSRKIVRVSLIGGAISLIIVSSSLSLPVGHLLKENDIQNAKAFCESLIPAVERYKKEKGIYPQDISYFIEKTQKTPRLLQNFSYYSSDGISYRFDFPDPGGMIDLFGYDNVQKKWHRYD